MAQIICGRVPKCGFRVHDRYYVEKQRFPRQICPNCNGPIQIVDDNTDHVIEGAIMQQDGSLTGV